ncbi:MAG: hypothetical protein RML56_09315 [Burkholderiales bacterium]|nr:hypothetical protein [Burkholderiales bacterium]
MPNRWLAPFLNLAHLLDHLAMLVFPTAVVAIGRDWGRSYSELLPLATGSFVAFPARSRCRRAGSPTAGAAIG